MNEYVHVHIIYRERETWREQHKNIKNERLIMSIILGLFGHVLCRKSLGFLRAPMPSTLQSRTESRQTLARSSELGTPGRGRAAALKWFRSGRAGRYANPRSLNPGSSLRL